MIGIYKFTNIINGKIYIGQSINIATRKKKHIADAYYPPSNTYNTLFHAAIRKYGIENFKFEVIHICIRDELDKWEKYYIQFFKTLAPYGYNMTTGGEHPAYYLNRFSTDDIKNIIKELRNTDDSSEDIAKRWNCSASLIKKISYGEEYFIDGEQYPIRSSQQIQRVHKKYNLFCNGINPAAKLNIPIVEQIVYDLLNSDDSITDLSKKYNISKDQISRINNGKIWLQVKRPIPCRNYKKDNENKALMVADLLLNTILSQKEILQEVGYKDRHTIQRINNHLIYEDLLKDYPNPIRKN